jgi:4-amino-4-deoxy-L-arabinose transferase-like glycosyltransferase
MRRAPALGLVAVVALASFFRLYDLGATPPGLFGDEAADANVAAAIRRGEHFPVYVEEETKWGSREPLFHYLMAAVFSVAGETPLAVRLTAASIGIATVPLAWWLYRMHLGTSIAFLGAALLAVCRWHVTASRLGLRAVLIPLWVVLTLLAASALWRRRTIASALLLGAVVGTGFYTYPAYWLMPPLLAAGLACGARRGRPPLALAVLALGAALLAAAPLIRYAAEKPEYFFGRATRTLGAGGGESEPSYRDGMMRVLFMLHLRGDENARHNLPGRPLLDPVSGVFFLLGLAGALRALAHNRGAPAVFAALIVLWLAFLLPSAVTDSAPHALRTLGAVPAVCAIAALGIHRAALAPPFGARAWSRFALCLAAVLAAGAWNYRDYFQQWARSPAVAAAFNSDAVAFFARLADLAERHDVYAAADLRDAPQARFLARARRARLRPLDAGAFAAAGADRDRIYVVATPLLNGLVLDLYPGAEVLLRYSSEGRADGRVYLVRRQRLRPELPRGYREAIARALEEDADE